MQNWLMWKVLNDSLNAVGIFFARERNLYANEQQLEQMTRDLNSLADCVSSAWPSAQTESVWFNLTPNNNLPKNSNARLCFYVV